MQFADPTVRYPVRVRRLIDAELPMGARIFAKIERPKESLTDDDDEYMAAILLSQADDARYRVKLVETDNIVHVC